jgi:hypothetical protein
MHINQLIKVKLQLFYWCAFVSRNYDCPYINNSLLTLYEYST